MNQPRIALIISLVLLTAALGSYTLLRQSVNEKSVAVASLNKQTATKVAETVRLNSVRERFAALGAVEGRLEAYFVPESSVVPFINGLQARGSALGAAVNIDSVATTPAAAHARPVLKVSITIHGTFDAVVRTLGSLEYAPYALSMTDLTLLFDPEKSEWAARANLVIGSTAGGSEPARALVPAPQTATTTPATTTPQGATTTDTRL